jgi:hypothetical protein
MGHMTESKAVAAFCDALDAHRPLIYIQSSEEQRVEHLLQAAAASYFKDGIHLFSWSSTDGLQENGITLEAELLNPYKLLDFVLHHAGPALFLLKDFHDYLRSVPEIRRRLRDIYYACLERNIFLTIVSPVKFIPEEINREVLFLTLPIPDIGELQMLLRSEADRIISGGGTATLDDDQMYVLARALQGLTYNEARHAIRRAVARDRSLCIEAIPLLLEEKRLLIGKTGLIEYIPDPTPLSQLGGLDNLKNWLQERHKLFQQRESISHEIIPKGVLMMGISGCGKSLSVKVIASAFDLPLYRLDMIQIFSGSVGNPEHAFVEACKTMEEIAPAVLWFDEIETSISANAAEASGILGRIFGFFLTWMQEKSPGLFVAATANRIDLLPAEMIRKGRFDQVFFIDLPTPAERVDILQIHLLKRGVNPDPLNMELFAKLTDGWTGAEVEQCVIGAMVSAQLNDRPVDNNDLFFSCKQIVPLSKTMKEQLNHIRSWAFERAIRASSRT